ncbi:MAG: Gfo/Idh/MocA family oxidoreductase [Planctomycetota bacterium]
MKITYRCEKCGKEFKSAETITGGQIWCTGCRQSTQKPTAQGNVPLADQTILVSLDQLRRQKIPSEKAKPTARPDQAQAGGTMVVPMRDFRVEIETEQDRDSEAVLGETMAASPEERAGAGDPGKTLVSAPEAGSSQQERTPSPRTEVGVGIIGVGWMGRKHAEALAAIPGARLVAVADVFQKTAERVGGELDVDSYTDPRELTEREDVDCVIIATNDEAHVQPVAAAASAGKPILLEKPIATTLADADQIIRICERANVKLMIGFVLRFDKRYARVKEAAANGEIGELESIFCRRTNLITSQERLKGRVSVLSFLGVHDFDIMRWVAGSEVKRVHAEAVWNLHKKRGHNVEDTTWTLLRFQNGVIGSLETGWIIPTTHPTKADFKLEVTGTKGMITYDLTRQELMFTTDQGHYAERFNPMLQYQMEHFLDCVRNDTEPLVTGIDGRAALEISLAAQQSAREERIVHLPLT